jgi:hypothetical protein
MTSIAILLMPRVWLQQGGVGANDFHLGDLAICSYDCLDFERARKLHLPSQNGINGIGLRDRSSFRLRNQECRENERRE